MQMYFDPADIIFENYHIIQLFTCNTCTAYTMT